MYQKNEKSQSLVTYNENGGAEETQDVQQIIKIEKRHFKKGEFFMQAFTLANLILEKEYGMPELKTLVALQTRLDFNNRIKTFTQTEIAKEIKSNQANVSRAIKKLEEDGIIKKDGLEWYFSDKYIKGAGDNKQKRK